MTIARAATALFVPGHRADRFEKALAAGADVVIIDLEDAVGAEHKQAARESAFAALTDNRRIRTAVRINPVDDPGRVADLDMLASVVAADTSRLTGVLIPKAEDPADLAAVSARLGDDVPLVPLVETAAGLAAAEDLARASQVVRLAFGAIDFGVDVDATSETIIDHARCEIVLASRRAGLAAPLDSPHPEFRDLDVVRHRAVASRSLGFGGQLCIHPAQIDVVASCFRPTAEDVAWAEKVVALGDGSATQLEGQMVDRPIFARAMAILERARRASS